MPKTKIPVYFITEDNEIKYQYVSPVELYKIYHWQESEENKQFIKDFMQKNSIASRSHISYNLETVKKKYERKKGYPCQQILQPEKEEIDTIKSNNYDALINDNSTVLFHCIDIYGNIVEVLVPDNKLDDEKYWMQQARQDKLLCNSDYLPFHYSAKDEELKKVKEEIVQTICGKTTVYCFYDTEMEGEYYKCYGIKFPVEEKMLSTIKSQSSKSSTSDFSKVKIYFEDKIEPQLEIGDFFHETIFKIGDTEIDLTPSKEEIDKLNSLPEYSVVLAYLPNKKDPKTEIITLIDSNETKNHSPTINENFVAKIAINRDENSKDYGKVTIVEFGTNKDTGKEYKPEEARKLLLVNCARKYKELSKNFIETSLDIVLSNPKYYTSKDCPVRLPDCSKILAGNWPGKELERAVMLCTDNLSNGSNMIMPITKKTPQSTYHRIVIIATKKNNEISFNVFDPSIAIALKNIDIIKQELGDYIYNHLDKEKYILSPDTPIQNSLSKHNSIFNCTCTGISTEYINYIIDNKQDKNPQKLTKEQGEEIQKRYATLVVNNGLHNAILEEQQVEQQTVKQETKSQETQPVEEKKTVATTQTKNTLQEKKITPENKSLPETRQVKQDEVVDKDEVKPEAISVKNNDTDKTQIKEEEITVRNNTVETQKQHLIETKFTDSKLKMDLIEYKEEEQKKKGSSSMEILKNIDKDNQVKETSKESSSLLSHLTKHLDNKSTDSTQQTLIENQEQKPSKNSWWSGKKKNSHEL